jgi:RNA polymerase sigma-70 factor (ECF subfamily)
MTAQGSLVAAFLAQQRADGSVPSELAESLEARLRAARCVWPAFELDAREFVGFLAARTIDAQLPAPEHAADLYLACACARQVRGALEALDAQFIAPARQAIVRVDSSAAFVEEALQTLREKLLVGGHGRAPKIADYHGRGPLRRWIMAAAARTASNLRRSRAARPDDALASDVRVDARDLELVYIKARYKSQFEHAVREALAGLDARDRALLRLHYSERLGVDRLGAIHRVGRSTAARWLSKARDRLLARTRAALTARLGLTESEFASLAALVVSDLDITLPEVLQSHGTDG